MQSRKYWTKFPVIGTLKFDFKTFNLIRCQYQRLLEITFTALTFVYCWSILAFRVLISQSNHQYVLHCIAHSNTKS